MSDNVVKFWPKNAAESPDAVLEQATGVYENVFILGYDKDGSLDVRASTNWPVKDIFFAMDAFRHGVLSGEYGDRMMERGDD